MARAPKTAPEGGEQTETTQTDTAASTPATETGATKSIINPKYKGKYKGASDFIGQMIDKECRSVDDKGKTSELNLTNLVELGRKNGLDNDKLNAYAADIGKKNAPGRLRMTIGNMLRAVALRRHGLTNLGGEFVEAPAEFVAGHEKTENADGSKIAKPTEAKTEGAGEQAAA